MSQNLLDRRSFFRASLLGGMAVVAAEAGPRLAAAAPKSAPAPEPKPAAKPADGIRLFEQPDLNFQALFALGGASYGAGEAGEIFATVDGINKAGADYQTFCDGFTALAGRMAKIASGAAKAGHAVSARSAHLRAAQYYNQSLFFILGTKTPDAEAELYRKMQEQWDAATKLFEPAFERVEIPYEGTHLPGYFLKSGREGRCPTAIVMNGSDAQFVDVYAFGGVAAMERGWNALIFEGPGQGSMLFEHEMPFRPDWEKVITPVVDFLAARPDVDAKRIALTGWSFGGLLATRAAAFETRLAAVVADPGSVDSWLAYPPQLRGLVEQGGSQEKVDQIWQKEVVPHLPPPARFTLSKRSEIYGRQFLEAARAGRMFDSLWTFAHTVQRYQVADVAPKIEMPFLVTQYEGEQYFPDGGEKLFDLLKGPKKLVKFTAGEGAALHDGPLAPRRRNQVVFDWLDETVGV
jgi:pimeloyl-ACP methyl ester carboxylesterase